MAKSLSALKITVHAAKHPNVILDHRTDKSRVNVQRLFPDRAIEQK